MKPQSKDSINEDLKARIKDQLSNLSYEQKQKLLDDIVALSTMYEEIMEGTPEDLKPRKKGRRKKQ